MQKGDGQYQCQFKLECNNSITSCNVCMEEVKLPPCPVSEGEDRYHTMRLLFGSLYWGGAEKAARDRYIDNIDKYILYISERKQTIHLNDLNKLEQIHVADAKRGKTCAASFFFFGTWPSG